MKVETYFALKYEVRITTKVRKHINQLYQVRYINNKISVAAFRLG